MGHLGQGGGAAGLHAARRQRARPRARLLRRLHRAGPGRLPRPHPGDARPVRLHRLQAQPVPPRPVRGPLGQRGEEAAGYFAEIRSIHPVEWEFAFEAHARIFEPRQAIQLGNALAPYDPLWFEEPIRPEYIPAWGHLRSQLDVPLATGESLFLPQDFLALLTAGGADIVQPDVCVVGGLAQMRRIATIAETHYASVAPHNPMGPLATAVNVHFAAAHHGLKLVEYKPCETTWCRTRTCRWTGTWSCGPTGPAGEWRSTSRCWGPTTTCAGSACCRSGPTARPVMSDLTTRSAR
ncbi:enolase C-terminal domain-like protein [Nonomuraea thailandensis]